MRLLFGHTCIGARVHGPRAWFGKTAGQYGTYGRRDGRKGRPSKLARSRRRDSARGHEAFFVKLRIIVTEEENESDTDSFGFQLHFSLLFGGQRSVCVSHIRGQEVLDDLCSRFVVLLGHHPGPPGFLPALLYYGESRLAGTYAKADASISWRNVDAKSLPVARAMTTSFRQATRHH